MLYSLDPLNNQYKGTQEILEIKKKKKKVYMRETKCVRIVLSREEMAYDRGL